MDRRSADILSAGAIVAAVALLYGHTLQVPFYLDDSSGIVDNYLIRDFQESLTGLFRQRGLSLLSFAINYQLTGLAPLPLHLVNITLHAGCGLLFWLLLRHWCAGRWLPLLGALLFVAHPLQTQAVTYLVQRATVLGAGFFLATLLCHLRAREAFVAGLNRSSSLYLRWYWGAVLCGACAVLSKENTAPLPLLLMAYDRLFPTGVARTRRRALLDYLPFFVVPVLLGCDTLGRLLGAGDTTAFYGELSSLQGNSPLYYLFTQFQVLWVYLRLLSLPFGQALEHNYPVVAELLNWRSLLGLAGLLFLGGAAWWLRMRRPLLVFGVVWFFLALAVESTIIPLDPLFEHRLYLPMGGFLLVLLDIVPRVTGARRACAMLGVALLVCAPLAWIRNDLWRDPIAFYEDNLKVAPNSERAMLNLCVAYEKAMLFREERELLERTVRVYPENGQAYVSLTTVYQEQGRHVEALELLERGLTRLPRRPELYEAAAEVARQSYGDEHAIAYLQRGLAVPGIERSGLLNDLGIIHSEAGDPRRAEQAFRDSIVANRRNPTAYRNLGKEYFAQQRWSEAVDSLQRALDLLAHHPETLEGLGKAALRAGDYETMKQAAATLKKVDSQGWRRLQNEIASMLPPGSQ